MGHHLVTKLDTTTVKRADHKTILTYFLSIFPVGPFSDPAALSQQFQEQHKAVEKLTADSTAKLRTFQVSLVFL